MLRDRWSQSDKAALKRLAAEGVKSPLVTMIFTV
jgi:hypothetical protein